MRNVPNPFELKVMRLALRGDADWLSKLRAQLPYLTVLKRRSTGSGFTTDFTVMKLPRPPMFL